MNGHSAHGLMFIGHRQLAETSKLVEPTHNTTHVEYNDPIKKSQRIFDGNVESILTADQVILWLCFDQACSGGCLGEFIETLLSDDRVPNTAIKILMPRFMEMYADAKLGISLEPNAYDQIYNRGLMDWYEKMFEIIRRNDACDF
jgi:hypothetical protein